MRKIIQIAGVPDTQHSFETIFALCDDGSLWIHDCSRNVWRRVTDIPQDEPKK